LVKAKFGLRVPSFPVDGTGGSDFVKQIVDFIGELDEVFESAWVCDHFVPWGDFVPNATPNLEGFTAVAYLSGIFKRLKFGNIVLCNSYRNPALLAKMGATLQNLTGGRYILGIGAGWKEDEYIAYGYEFPEPKVRIRQLEEGVQIIRKMWTEDAATFDGKYYSIRDAICIPKPKPVPSIMIGGGGEKLTLRVVARHADWWNLPNVSPSAFQQKIEVLGKHCSGISRDPTEIVKSLANMAAIAETGGKARTLASKSPFINMEKEENYIIGDPDEVTEKLSEYTKLGIEHFILRFVDFPKTDGAKLFAGNVIPALAP
jgi:alkanesulfonate monooxygenase SsuD/methylene tetrahydromethanopterin reductase-like flavin-dependent oxidoreductase (luciferase family)